MKTQGEVSIEIREQDGILVSIMHLPGVTTIVPLEKGAAPPTSASLPEPRHRIIRTTC